MNTLSLKLKKILYRRWFRQDVEHCIGVISINDKLAALEKPWDDFESFNVFKQYASNAIMVIPHSFYLKYPTTDFGPFAVVVEAPTSFVKPNHIHSILSKDIPIEDLYLHLPEELVRTGNTVLFFTGETLLLKTFPYTRFITTFRTDAKSDAIYNKHRCCLDYPAELIPVRYKVSAVDTTHSARVGLIIVQDYSRKRFHGNFEKQLKRVHRNLLRCAISKSIL